MRLALRLALILALALAAYLLFWPVPIDPVAWDAPEAPRLEGRFAKNGALADVVRLGEGVGIGPEDVASGRKLERPRRGRTEGRRHARAAEGRAACDALPDAARPAIR